MIVAVVGLIAWPVLAAVLVARVYRRRPPPREFVSRKTLERLNDRPRP